jgi:hypothetical protein
MISGIFLAGQLGADPADDQQDHSSAVFGGGLLAGSRMPG